MSESQTTPEVLWAQRSSSSDPSKNFIYLTISVPDVSDNDMKLDIQPTKLTFTGKSHTKKVTYHVELEFYAEIDPAETKVHHTDRDLELVLRKKELKEEYWPRLLKDSKRVHFLKTDFDKWVDEDEQNAVDDDDDFMSRMSEQNNFGGIDFSKLGGAEGLGAGANDDSDEDLPTDDEDMPELEGDTNDKGKGEEAKGETGASAQKTSSGIEEVE